MTILYLSLSYVPSRRASSVHVMRMCAAMTRAGHDVTLIAKRNHEASAGDDDFAFYGVSPRFGLDKLPRPKWRGGGVVFGLAVARTLLDRRRRVDLVYSRDIVGAVAAARLGMPLVYESHAVPHDWRIRALTRWLVRQPALRGHVVISEALRRDLAAEGMAPRHAPTIVAHDAADAPPPLGVRPVNPRPRIGYVGNLYAGRGIEVVVDVARRLPHYDVEVVGGSEKDLAAWRARPLPENLTFVGFVPPATLLERYQSFDVLLMPHSRSGVVGAVGGDISRWTSPMKMFEYMAAGVPIVASDLPVLGEVLHDRENALIAPAGDIARWTAAVEELITDRALARRLAERAYHDLVREYTWDARVRRILGGIS